MVSWVDAGYNTKKESIQESRSHSNRALGKLKLQQPSSSSVGVHVLHGASIGIYVPRNLVLRQGSAYATTADLCEIFATLSLLGARWFSPLLIDSLGFSAHSQGLS